MNPAIIELNSYVKTTLQPSKVHGVGLFALRSIEKGQKLYSDMAPKVYKLPYRDFRGLIPSVRKEIEKHWPGVVNDDPFVFPVTRLQAYINHSSQPNYDPIHDVTLRKIKKGEEITEDYTLIPNSNKVYTFLH